MKSLKKKKSAIGTKMNISKLCLLVYCYAMGFFWELLYDAIYIISLRVLRMCKFVEQRISNIHDIVDKNF